MKAWIQAIAWKLTSWSHQIKLKHSLTFIHPLGKKKKKKGEEEEEKKKTNFFKNH